MTIIFVAFALSVIVSAHLDGNNESAFEGSLVLVWDIFGYLFLLQVIVMTLLVIWLFVETQRAVNR